MDSGYYGPLWAHAMRVHHAWAQQHAQKLILHEMMDGALKAGEGRPLELQLKVSGLDTTLRLSEEEVWQVHIPLLVLLADTAISAQRRGGETPARAIVGIAGAAGSGKSTLAQALRAIGGVWHARMCAAASRPSDGAIFGAYASAFIDSGNSNSRDDSTGGIITKGGFIEVLSMDAYHRTNADLDAAGLRGVKGRIDTIDAAAFARDLRSLRTGAGADCDGTLWLPEYDRAVTHDPQPRCIRVRAHHSVVLVEGLYLCSAGKDGPAPDASGASAPHPAWGDVRACLDWVAFLDVPLEVCKARAGARKSTRGGRMSLGAANEHFDRVDAPVWRDLQADAKRACGGALAALLDGEDAVRPVVDGGSASGTGPDLVLRFSPPDASDVTAETPVHLAASSLRHAQWVPALRGSAGVRRLPQAVRVLVTGLNPCVQRSVVFQPPVAAQRLGEPPHPAWRRGEVNRASEAHVTVGGKGQHVAIGLARAAAAHAAQLSACSSGSSDGQDGTGASRVSVCLAHFMGGTTGSMASGYLSDSFEAAASEGTARGLAPAEKSGEAAPVAASSTAAAAPGEGPAAAPAAAAAATLRQLKEWLDPSSQPTRTCTTVLDASVHDMTELIEPPAPVTQEQVARLLQAASAQVTGTSTDDVDGSDSAGARFQPLAGVALMGTFPPGAEGVHQALSALVASQPAATDPEAPPDRASPGASSQSAVQPAPVVLLDAVKGALPCLLAGGVHVLKINADELGALHSDAHTLSRKEEAPQRYRAFGDALASAGAALATNSLALEGRDTTARVRAHALALLWALRTQGARLRAVAVTDGPRAAHLIEALSHAAHHAQPALEAAGPGEHSAPTTTVPSTVFGCRHTVYHLPPLPGGRAVVNPIGAGDSVAATTLYRHAVAGEPLGTSFARGLASGSASCLTMRGAVWACADEDAVFAGITAVAEEVCVRFSIERH